MVTYTDLFTFVIMLCAVITLVIYIKRKKQRHTAKRIHDRLTKEYGFTGSQELFDMIFID